MIMTRSGLSGNFVVFLGVRWWESGLMAETANYGPLSWLGV